jgi:hypothetical protein
LIIIVFLPHLANDVAQVTKQHFSSLIQHVSQRLQVTKVDFAFPPKEHVTIVTASKYMKRRYLWMTEQFFFFSSIFLLEKMQAASNVLCYVSLIVRKKITDAVHDFSFRLKIDSNEYSLLFAAKLFSVSLSPPPPKRS